MPALLGLAALLGLMFLVRGFTLGSARGMANGFRFTGGLLVALLAVALFMMREIGLAFLAAGGAWVLLFGSQPPWQNVFSGWRSSQGGANSAPGASPRTSSMSRSEALKVLGLEEGANEETIRAAHRRLILQNHPDKGGSSYLAAKINEAKDVLLNTRRV